MSFSARSGPTKKTLVPFERACNSAPGKLLQSIVRPEAAAWDQAKVRGHMGLYLRGYWSHTKNIGAIRKSVQFCTDKVALQCRRTSGCG